MISSNLHQYHSNNLFSGLPVHNLHEVQDREFWDILQDPCAATQKEYQNMYTANHHTEHEDLFDRQNEQPITSSNYLLCAYCFLF